MGWFFTHSSKEGLIRELISASESAQCSRITVAHAVRGNVLWTVNQVTVKATGERRVFIGCDLMEKYEGQWGYKPLCEEDHPYYYSCPLKYLGLAPVQNAEWRQKVHEYHARRSRRFEVGQLVELIGCSIPYVRITGVSPLTGAYQGINYRLSRRQLGEILTEEWVSADGRILTTDSTDSKSSVFQGGSVTAS